MKKRAKAMQKLVAITAMIDYFGPGYGARIVWGNKVNRKSPSDLGNY
jgi:hypothetical protein